jgi:CheY-like chemotaxis protein
MKIIDTTCIIDDDPIFVFGTKKIMELSNFCKNFMIFNNGQEALISLAPLLKSGKDLPDIILLDLNMPIMDGWQFLDEFIKIPSKKKVTIYIVSSSIDPVDLSKVNKYDAVSNYIVKPITVDKLQEMLADLN